jgi:hypothetical protein
VAAPVEVIEKPQAPVVPPAVAAAPVQVKQAQRVAQLAPAAAATVEVKEQPRVVNVAAAAGPIDVKQAPLVVSLAVPTPASAEGRRAPLAAAMGVPPAAPVDVKLARAVSAPAEPAPVPVGIKKAAAVSKWPGLPAAPVLEEPAAAKSVVVAAPPAVIRRTATEVREAEVKLEPAAKKMAPQPIVQAAAASARSPYLERLSTGEVALVTTPQPLWRPNTQVRVARAEVQWLPLNATSRHAEIRILNAARSEGLAAHTRIALRHHGWQKMAIGDADRVRRRSLVLYSAQHEGVARRLAAQLRCRAVKVQGSHVVLVLLGRDATYRRAASSRA